MIDKSFIRLAKKKIIYCLTEEFQYGLNKKTGVPLKRKRKNFRLLDKKEGYQCYTGLELKHFMDSIILGLYFAMNEYNKDNK